MDPVALAKWTIAFRKKYPDRYPCYQRYTLTPTQRLIMLLIGTREEKFWAEFYYHLRKKWEQ